MSDRGIAHRLSALSAVLLLLAGVAHATPAPAQAADPVVTVTASQGSAISATDCKGETRTDITDPILITVTRTGDTSTSIVVNLSYGGSLAGSSGLAPKVPLGGGETVAVFDAGAEATGDLTVELEPGAGYTVGSPAGASTSLGSGIADLGCNLGDVSTTQTVERGTTPAAIDVEDVALNPPADLARSIEGTVPTGTTYHPDGTWSGVTTELGTFRFREYFCEDDGWCPYRADIEVVVVESGPIPPVFASPRTPSPAQAVPGTPSLTG